MGAGAVDVVVIGAGIVGLATARALHRREPGRSIVVLEKEPEVGTHQTGHNSGVIHAGIYYAPGSLKADLCRRGAEATKAFARERGIPFETPGKLVVATDAVDLERMKGLEERARANGIALRRVDKAELRELEPEVTGEAALLVPETGIISYGAVARELAAELTESGVEIRRGAEVVEVAETATEVHVGTATDGVTARTLVACAGLQSDRIATLAGLQAGLRIVPFRGEYHRLRDERAGIVRHLIYPVPDPDLPFLGVHLSPMIDGSVTVGPNAVLGLSREGYGRGSLSARDVAALMGHGGFWRMAAHHWRTGITEMRNSLDRSGYLRLCQRYCPSLTLDDLLPHPAGIRAQAVDDRGQLLHDFVIASTARSVHVLNAPSPAATSALPIGEMIADRLLARPGVSS